jgi:ATP/maltotriose-dependent transcriptional regulator MalT
VVEVGPDELAMDPGEAGSLLEGADVDLAAADVDELVRRTEGWPTTSSSSCSPACPSGWSRS